MKERLARYGILSLYNIAQDGYSLKYVKIDPEDVENNPIFKKAQEAKRRLEMETETERMIVDLEEKEDREMRDYNYIDQQEPSFLNEELVFGYAN